MRTLTTVKAARLLVAAALAGGAVLAAMTSLPTNAKASTVAPTLVLAAAAPVTSVGVPVFVTATADEEITSPSYIEIFDTSGVFWQACTNTATCTFEFSNSSQGSITYIAYIAAYSTTAPPPSIQATSNTATVTWTAASPPGDYSDSCTSPTLTLFDGYIGGAYVRLLVQQGSTQTLVCFRAAELDGDAVVTTSTAGFGTPSVDNNASACSTTTGNTVPGPHPLVSGIVLNQPTLIDTYASTAPGGATAWICFQNGAVVDRIVIPVAASDIPLVSVNQDNPGSGAPFPAPGVAGYPSSSCDPVGNGFLNAKSADGSSAWASIQEPNSTTVDVCARVQGPVSAGGVLSVNASNSGVTPVVQTSTNTSACNFVIVSLTNPVPLLLSTASPGTNPAVVCVG